MFRLALTIPANPAITATTAAALLLSSLPSYIFGFQNVVAVGRALRPISAAHSARRAELGSRIRGSTKLLASITWRNGENVSREEKEKSSKNEETESRFWKSLKKRLWYYISIPAFFQLFDSTSGSHRLTQGYITQNDYSPLGEYYRTHPSNARVLDSEKNDEKLRRKHFRVFVRRFECRQIIIPGPSTRWLLGKITNFHSFFFDTAVGQNYNVIFRKCFKFSKKKIHVLIQNDFIGQF